ncbi:MBL fold metallo-hydrolase, partial [Lysinibacillus sp. GbtcB16]|uniref:MBL fold metallo-hydrolase n=1 Tax=Lysinibacillus sp. GbtcB16 TaxID=2824761 RepID=UPI001C2F2903
GDSTVNGGLITELSPLFPNHGINIESRVKALPADSTIPGLPEWQWVHTPGHTPGHISLFREKDRSLIAGDAFVTVKQE